MDKFVVDVNDGLRLGGTQEGAIRCLVTMRPPRLQAPSETLGSVLQGYLAADEVCLLTRATVG